MLPIQSKVKGVTTLGIGVLSAKARASAAYLASHIDTEELCTSLAGNFNNIFKLNSKPHVEDALKDWSTRAGLNATTLDELKELLEPTKSNKQQKADAPPPSRKTQARLSDFVTIHRTSCIVNNCDDKRLAVLRKQCSLPRAKQWLMNSPTRFLKLHIDHAAYCRRIAFHCGQTVCPHRGCPRIGCKIIMDPKGDHLIRCNKKSSAHDHQLIWRHTHRGVPAIFRRHSRHGR